jgi:hypothetical protein
MPMDSRLPDLRQNEESAIALKMEEESSGLRSHFTEPNMIKDLSSESDYEHGDQYNPIHKSESRLESV